MTPLALVRPTGATADAFAAPTGAREDGGSAPPLDDIAVNRVRLGDPASWEAAYLAYGRQLMGFLMVRLEHRDDAAEALSETFARAIEKVGGFRGDGAAFRAWLFRIARNVATDRQRARGRVVLRAEEPEGADRIQPSGEDRAIAAEDRREIQAAFAGLPAEDRELLWLRVCAGLSAGEVGEVVGKRPGAVRMQQMRALQALSAAVPR